MEKMNDILDYVDKITDLEYEAKLLNLVIQKMVNRIYNKACPNTQIYSKCKNERTEGYCKRCWIDYFMDEAEKELKGSSNGR